MGRFCFLSLNWQYGKFVKMCASRIPLPELKDSDKLDKVMNMKEAARRVRLGPECLPSICFYTFLNAYQVGKRGIWAI